MALPYIDETDLDRVNFLESEGRDYCVTHGMVHKNAKGSLEHIPFTLFPSPFPRRLFTAAKEVQADFNLLVHKVSRDYEFTKSALSSTVAADPFTSRLFGIYEKVLEQDKVQPISLGIFRSDYMIDTSGFNNNDKKDSDLYIKQVEINTISLGGVSFSSLVPDMHRHLLSLVGKENKIPPNPALDEIADALIKAWELYGSPSAVVMFVVQPGEWNVFCQRLLEYRVIERNPNVRVIRRSLGEIFDNHEMDKENALFVTGTEVAVAYFRAGYTPKDYPTENEWSARLTLELSRCIKCPTVAYQLMGTKKMQQVFSKPGVLERFLPNKDLVDRVRRTFTGLYSLDPGPEGDYNMKCCLAAPEKFVLKPQREGGGNNLFGEDITRTLLGNPENRMQYILMDLIPGKIDTNFMVYPGYASIQSADVNLELGIVGILISRGGEVLVNKESGYLLRTKLSQYQEGGVSSGKAAFDSPYLVEQD